MPPIFKALASITAWILFIGACIGMLGTSLSFWVNIELGAPAPLIYQVGWGSSAAQLTLAVVVMKLRQMLE